MIATAVRAQENKSLTHRFCRDKWVYESTDNRFVSVALHTIDSLINVVVMAGLILHMHVVLAVTHDIHQVELWFS